MTIYSKVNLALGNALSALVADGVLPEGIPSVTCDIPSDKRHGDLTTNCAMVLSKSAKMNPRQLAEKIVEKLEGYEGIDRIEIAGAGFINFHLNADMWVSEIHQINNLGEDYGRINIGNDKSVNIEFVSANPTGPLHIGHCRGAIVGDSLARLMEFTGHKVIREYYINDAGEQVNVLARSAYLRYLEALSKAGSIDFTGLYPGEYLCAVGEELAEKFGEKYLDLPEEDWLELFRDHAIQRMMDLIKNDLSLLGINHDVFSSEKDLHNGKIEEAVEWLRRRGLVYDGILDMPYSSPDDWKAEVLPLFRSKKYGDSSDRALKKSDGSWTYFAADIAYHLQKAQTADELINIWGADHSGAVTRLEAALSNFETSKPVKLIFVQMVRLLRNNVSVTMSKRAGTFITVSEIIQEVGRDALRFHMVSRSSDSHMDFDVVKAVEASRENPLFYVQYAHARISTTMSKLDDLPEFNPDLLSDREIALVKKAAQFPRVIEQTARDRAIHRIPNFLYELASEFHSYWTLGNTNPEFRLITDDNEVTASRMYVAQAVQQVIKNGLSIIGVDPMDYL